MDKGFGFITPDGESNDIFFHGADLVGITFEELQEGAKVTFEVTQGPKGANAKNVQLVK